MLSPILSQYNITEFTAELIVSGLINKTWKITSGNTAYILQRINHNVFRKPLEVAENLRRLDSYLQEHSPGYLFVAPLSTTHEQAMVEMAGGFYRLFPFIEGSHTVSVVRSPGEAYEAAHQFGKFTCLLSGFDATSLHITIPDFHNLSLRYEQFEHAVSTGNAARIASCRSLIDELRKRHDIVRKYVEIQRTGAARVRVMHHDTKISNVLFDSRGKGLCVIDLDTVMPGYFISDVGDMMRTYLSPASEEVTDLGLVQVRDEFFQAIVHGYMAAMRDELTTTERSLFCYSGLFLIYMQALRFLADHCNNDVYYGAAYEDHNYFRALNQLTLLQRFEEKLVSLEEIVKSEK